MEPLAKVDFDLRLRLPSHALLVGASQSGKTRLALYLLSNPHLFEPKPQRILFYYDQFQESYLSAKASLAADHGIELLLYKGLTSLSLDSIEKLPGQTILLIDDFSEETSGSTEIARIATNGRHLNLSLWLVWHSLFSKHPASRIITQNVNYIFLLPSLRLESQLGTFGVQLGMKKRLLDAYRASRNDMTQDHRYLLVDLGPNTPDILRLRSQIDQSVQFCFP